MAQTNETGVKLTVAQLRAKFERIGGRSTETPAEFQARTARQQASKQNLLLRSQVLTNEKNLQQSHNGNPNNDLKEPLLLESNPGEQVLEWIQTPPKVYDVIVDDPEIDSMNTQQLRNYIKDLGGEDWDCSEVADLRLRAYDLKCAKFGGITEDGFMLFNNSDEQEPTGGFFAPELAAALASGKERQVNRAILKFFFEENAPERVSELDFLLDANKGWEEELFKKLAMELDAKQSSKPSSISQSLNSSSRNERVHVAFVALDPVPSSLPNPGLSSSSSSRRRTSYVVGGVMRGNEWTVAQAFPILQANALAPEMTPEPPSFT